MLGFGTWVRLVNAFFVVNLHRRLHRDLAMYIAIRGLALVLTHARSIFELPSMHRRRQTLACRC